MSKFILYALIFCFTPGVFAEEESLLDLQKSLQNTIQSMARVQFGVEEVVAVSIDIRLKKQIPRIPEELDMGYLPPTNFGSEAYTEKPLKERIDSTLVGLVISSRIDQEAVRNFQNLVKKNLASFKPVVQMQVVAFTEPFKKEIPLPEPPKDELKRSELIKYALIASALFFLGVLIYLGMMTAGGSLMKAAHTLSNALFSIKPPKAEEAKPKDLAKLAHAQRQDEERLDLEHSVTVLKRLCREEPLRVSSFLDDSEENRAGLRWLLSRLSSEEQNRLKIFLGQDRIAKLAQASESATQLNLPTWTRSTVEKLTVLSLKGKNFLEEALTQEEVAYVYQMDRNALFDAALRAKNECFWKLAFEVLAPEFMVTHAHRLSDSDWEMIMSSAQVSAEEIRHFFPQLREQSSVMSVARPDVVEFGKKIVDPLLVSLREMEFGKDDAFLERIQTIQPYLKEEIERKFWTLSTLRRAQESSLRNFIALQPNENLFALLFCAPEQERDFLQSLIPEGIKKTVVLDLLNRSFRENSQNDARSLLSQAREILEEALKQHLNNKLPLRPELKVVDASFEKREEAA